MTFLFCFGRDVRVVFNLFLCQLSNAIVNEGWNVRQNMAFLGCLQLIIHVHRSDFSWLHLRKVTDVTAICHLSDVHIV